MTIRRKHTLGLILTVFVLAHVWPAHSALADPGKARFHDKERALLAAIEAEQARQGAGGGGEGEEEPPPPEEESF